MDWGGGIFWYVKIMKKYKIPIVAIVDGNKIADCKESKYEGIPVLSFEQCCEAYPEAWFVISAPAHSKAIAERIHTTLPKNNSYCFDPTLDVLQNRKSFCQCKEFYVQKAENLLRIFHSLEDEISKETMKIMIYGSVTSNTSYYEKFYVDNIYFPDFIRKELTKEEVYVDVGAYIGDSVLGFLEAVENTYHKIYAFEPDYNNAAQMKKNTEKINITIVPKGCYSESGTMYFLKEKGDAVDGEGHITCKQNATCQIEVVKLDDVIKEQVTYIKMDVEGSELEVLKGAEKLINTYHPKLAISIYHKIEDIVEIPEFVLKKGYRLYMRHQWKCGGTDTVLYCL